jgi:hypothetical protein
MLDTWIALLTPLSVWVNPPQNANRAPDFDLIYGLELLSTFDNQRAWVLFGDTEVSGEIEPGLPYVMLAAPRGTWSQRATLRIGTPRPSRSRHFDRRFPQTTVAGAAIIPGRAIWRSAAESR